MPKLCIIGHREFNSKQNCIRDRRIFSAQFTVRLLQLETLLKENMHKNVTKTHCVTYYSIDLDENNLMVYHSDNPDINSFC